MIAFINYSIKSNEFPIITVLSDYLKNRFVVETLNSNELDNEIDRQSPFFGSSLFIGIITSGGTNKEAVKKLFKLADERNIPSFLFEEVGSSDETSVNTKNEIKFYRSNPDEALRKIERKIKEVFENVSSTKEATFVDSKELAWIVSGSTATNVINWISRIK